jgi:LysR family transcriptional regulator, nitrogen assimilation regulatory protein
MDLRQITHFVAVYEEGSFSQAARRENCTQPGLSVQIRNLEEQLAISLFNRTPRGVEATVAGKRFYEHCVAILNRVATARQQMAELAGGVTGTIRIGMPPSISRGALPATLSRFTRDFPFVELRLSEAYGGTLTDWIAAGEIDIGVVTRPLDQDGLSQQLLSHQQLALVSGPHCGRVPLKPVRIADLAPLKLVLSSRRHAMRDIVDAYLQRAGVTPAAIIDSDGLNTTLEFVRRSDWSTITPVTSIIEDLDPGRLCVNPITRPRVDFDYFLIRPTRAPLTAAAERFVAYLTEELDTISLRWRDLTRQST